MGTAEVESALVAHPKVAEAAVVGYPHDIKGQGIYAYVTLVADAVLMISWPPSYANGHEKKSAPSQRPTYCNGRHNCRKRARARSCGAFYGKSPPMNMIS